MLLFSNPLTHLADLKRPAVTCICGTRDCNGECEELLGFAEGGGA